MPPWMLSVARRVRTKIGDLGSASNRSRTKIGDLGSASAASPPLGSWCRHPLSFAKLLHALLSYDKLGGVLDDHVMHPRLSTRFEVSAPIDGADCWFVRADDLRYVHWTPERSSINHAVAISAQAAERPSITRQTIVDFQPWRSSRQSAHRLAV